MYVNNLGFALSLKETHGVKVQDVNSEKENLQHHVPHTVPAVSNFIWVSPSCTRLSWTSSFHLRI